MAAEILAAGVYRGRFVAANTAWTPSRQLPCRATTIPTWAPRNTANTVVMAAGVGCFVAAMATGAVAIKGPFRAFSAAIPLSYGALAAISLGLRPRDGPAPSTGAQERTMAYSYQVWLAVLAGLLLRRRSV